MASNIFKKVISRIFKNKKIQQTEEKIEKNLQEFGTNDHDEIEKIIKVLDRRNYKTKCNNIDLLLGKINKHTHMIFVHTLACRHRIIARERRILRINDDKLCPTEEMLINLDNKILSAQLTEKGYDLETKKTIIENIRKKYQTTRYDLYSNNIEDYEINEDLSVSLKPAKDRYQNALNAYEEETKKLLNGTKTNEEKTV